MAGLFQRLFGKLLGGSKPAPLSPAAAQIQNKAKQGKVETEEEFHKKIATREGRESILDEMERKFRQQAANKQQEEIAKRHEEAKAREPWYRFVYLGIPLQLGIDFTSSNPNQSKAAVKWVQYDHTSQSLYIEYVKSGCLYRYWPISEKEAASIYASASKGIWTWDNLRRRGTKLGHRKNYSLVGGGTPATSTGGYQTGTTLPQWTQTEQQIREHDAQVVAESEGTAPVKVMQIANVGQKAPYNALGKFARTTPKGNQGKKP